MVGERQSWVKFESGKTYAGTKPKAKKMPNVKLFALNLDYHNRNKK